MSLTIRNTEKDISKSYKTHGLLWVKKNDISIQFLSIDSSKVNKKVVIAPWWEPSIFNNIGDNITLVNKIESSTIKVWNIHSSQGEFTYIKTGIGVPMLTDIELSLGVTDCNEILFIGSVGSLDPNINIGDIVIPEYSICGDGISRYLKEGKLHENDPFGDKSYPDKIYSQKLSAVSKGICSKNNVKFHKRQNFSIETIFAQFAFIDEIQALGCNVIEMETASAFKAAELAKISIAALFSVSDNTIQKKSLVSGRSESEIHYRKHVRKNVFPLIIKELLFKD